MPPRTRALLAALLALLAIAAATTSTVAAFPNGQAKPSDLAPIFGGTDSHGQSQLAYLRKGAVAASWNTMNLCANAAGVALSPGASAYRPAATAYRTYAVQVILKRQLGRNAATPGASNHGLGLAVDLRTIKMRQWIDLRGPPFGYAKKTSDAAWEWWHIKAAGAALEFGRPDPGSSFRFPNLYQGSGGTCQAPAVREAQRRLGVPADGEYGPRTSRARAAFQKAHHIHERFIGSKTWLALRKFGRGLKDGRDPRTIGNTLPGQTAPMAGQDVRAIQGLLNARFGELDRAQYKVKVDGVTDARLTNAVKRFQVLVNRRSAKLKVTGVVNDRTYAWLLKSFAPSQVGNRFGPDISVHQGAIDTAAIKRGGATFVIQKIGEGQDFIDKTFTVARVRQLRAAKFDFGVHTYHYLHPRPGRAGAVEAQFALATALSRTWRRSDGVLWADLEETKLSPAGTCGYVQSFEDFLVRQHVRTGVYTYPGFAHKYLAGCPQITARASWRAHYGAKAPDPFPWTGRPVLWQYTDHGQVKGISGRVDLNVGLAQELVKLHP